MSDVGHDTISAPIRSAFSAGATVPWTVVAMRERGSERLTELSLAPRKFVVGKSPSCDIVIDDPCVSAMHCVLERRGDGALMVRDCESKNGTFLDGNPVLGAEVRPGTVLLIGRTHLVALGDRNPASALEQLRGSEPRFRAAVDVALRAARSECSVLIVGETGTGKDLVARAIHEASPRAAGPFVPINCGAFPRELIGSELFGHTRGAFTGATEARDGVFVYADGGTLFLDELGELPLDLQPHLLRVLETRIVRPVGGSVSRAVDVRFVAATNRLDGLGSPASTIRFDLYHRVAAVVVTMPPLRARKADIPELAEVFLDELAPRHGRRRLRPGAIDAMLAYDWPGNVRELRQAITRAVSMSDDDLDQADLGLDFAAPMPWSFDPLPALAAPGRDAPMRTLRASDGVPPPLPRHELALRTMMARSLEQHGSLRAAARDLGMPKSTFCDKARRFGLTIPKDR